MKVSKKLLIVTCATIGACFLGANAYAESLTIKIDDAAFYNALKTCKDTEPITERYYLRNTDLEHYDTVACGDFTGAVFDDSSTSIIFAEAADIDNVTYIYLPHMNLKNVDDALKFPKLEEANYLDNHIEEINMDEEHYYYAMISRNSLKKAPLIYDIEAQLGDDIDNNLDDYLVGTMYGYSIYMNNQHIEDEYIGDNYMLPPFVTGIRRFLNIAINNLNPNATEEQKAAQYDFYDVNNWLYLENATINSEGTKITAIDPTKEMKLIYRRLRSDLADGDVLNVPSRDREWVRYLHGDGDEYFYLATLVVKPKNSLVNPDTDDNVIAISMLSTISALISSIYVYRKAQR
jgi:hypothetical protein